MSFIYLEPRINILFYQPKLRPPGCGKTMLARAIAKETGFRFLVIQPSVVNDKYIGESEKIIQVLALNIDKL